MIAPQLTQEWFEECLKRGLAAHGSISKYNAKNCRKDVSKTIPKALREEDGWNAYLIIKNHRGRFKYMGMVVEEIAGALHIRTNPELIWTGYVNYGKEWYAVDGKDLLAGRIPASSKIVFPEVEHAPAE